MAPSVPRQRSLEDPGRPISDTPFCVIDVETTGESLDQGAITEIGAVRIRGGVCEGSWSTLIDPGRPIPARITALTGICAATVAEAPPFRRVVDELVEFVGDAVLVGHNIRYDQGFLAAEFIRAGCTPIGNPTVCTLALARRLLRDEVPNCSLGTLAEHLRLDHRPNHRALDDVLATVDLFHLLLERAATWGVLGLEDLHLLPRLAGHPQAAKLSLTKDLPRAPGVYLFRDRSGTIIYVGKATDLRSRVRSYFGQDDRRKVTRMLRELATIDHEVCAHPLAAAVREVHLIAEHRPRFNSRATRARSMAYLTLTDEPFARFSVVRRPPAPGSVHLGPLVSAGAGHRIIDAVTSVVPLRRCTRPIPRGLSDIDQLAFAEMTEEGARATRTPCTPAQLGVASCPCSGDTTTTAYAAYLTTIRQGFTDRPDVLLNPLRNRIDDLARQQRFEEAAEARDRAVTLAESLRRQRRLETWRRARRVVLSHPDGSGAELVHGLLGRVWHSGDVPPAACDPVPSDPGPVLREEVYERLCIITEIERAGSPWRIDHVDGLLAEAAARIEDFRPRGRPRGRPGR